MQDESTNIQRYQKLEQLTKNLLTESEKQIIDLRLEGKTDRQIAAFLGITRQAVTKKKQRLYRIIDSLIWWDKNKQRILTKISTALTPREAKILQHLTQGKTIESVAILTKSSQYATRKRVRAVLGLLAEDEGFKLFIERMNIRGCKR